MWGAQPRYVKIVKTLEKPRPASQEAQAADTEPWTMVIRPQRPWFDLGLDELWQARDLIALFVWRNFASVYKQTILGPLWHIVQPLLTTVVFTIIFGQVVQVSTDGLPQFLFYMAGTVIWGYFAACLGGTSNTLVANAHIFGKVYFPRLAVPLSVLISNLVTFGIRGLMFLGFLAFFMLTGAAVQPTAWLLVTPLLVLIMAGIGMGFGIIIASLTTRYRDLQYLVGFGTQLFMYATPVIYPLSTVPESYRWLMALNPIAPIVETFRRAFLGAGTVSWLHLLYSFGFMLVLLLAGLLIFRRAERSSVDTT